MPETAEISAAASSSDARLQSASTPAAASSACTPAAAASSTAASGSTGANASAAGLPAASTRAPAQVSKQDDSCFAPLVGKDAQSGAERIMPGGRKGYFW